MSCKLILVGNMKGGTGKSSLTIAFANYLSYVAQKKTLVIDGDIFQETVLNRYLLSLAESNKKTYKVLSSKTEDIYSMVDQFYESFDFIFLDLPGTIAIDGLLNVLLLADHFFIPTNYSFDDLKATMKYIDIINKKVIPLRNKEGYETTIHGIGYMVMPNGIAHKEFIEHQKNNAVPIPFFNTVVPFSEVFQRKNDISFLNNYKTKYFNIDKFYNEFKSIVL